MEKTMYLVVKIEEDVKTGKKRVEILREYRGHQIKYIQEYVEKRNT